ncbi:DUF202 domain-containing protein [Cyanobacterium stanieri LEGE 03274]|uniref:DUF202 domain-containing protein n=1 Tax=Cyanobacterium stanieri LEGE 03274 TaxID=1828756 RepID=A0ABR9V0I9_9CHRO|nr:DUF202 domain-containing protein [Cyanobacterium stanieri]MBE9221390.1 DUF202 domain-containing protein [Cyanobacterium stanieri LEGE 03274]
MSKKAPSKFNASRIRDHLANERTYLAWMRTAVGLMGFGVVILRLPNFQPPEVPRLGISWKMGLLFASVGLITVLLSTIQYFSVRRAIDQDTYEPSDKIIILFSGAIRRSLPLRDRSLWWSNYLYSV